jgi:hypothetical protein
VLSILSVVVGLALLLAGIGLANLAVAVFGSKGASTEPPAAEGV